jgi:stage II sporulation protein R
MRAIKHWITKERKFIEPAILCGLLFTLSLGWFTKAYSETTQKAIASGVVRFHVLANSDEPWDQELKAQVRDGILLAFRADLSASDSREQTKAYLQDHLNEIQECAVQIVRRNGYSYPVTVGMSRDFFPTKNYGDLTFPPGEYEALRVVIGAGAGQNWWCVMFPPLCYVDVTKSNEDNKEEKSEEKNEALASKTKKQLKEAVGSSKYLILSDTDRDKNVTVKVKFKLVEWWQNFFRKDKQPRPQTESEEKKYVLRD